MKFDLHIHSKHSGDSKSSAKDILKAARERDLAGLAFLDHNTLSGYKEARKIAEDMDLILVPGIEVSTPAGHVGALGLQEEIGRQEDIESAVETIREHGGLAVAVHPFRFWSGIGKDNVLDNHWDSIEGMNGRTWPRKNRMAQKLADSLDLPVVGGSDSHRLKTVGKSYTIFEKVDSWEEAIKEIERKNTHVGGVSRTLTQTFFYVRRAVWQWLKRGCTRI